MTFAAQWKYVEEANEVIALFSKKLFSWPPRNCSITTRAAFAAYRHAYQAALRERDMIAKLVNLSDDD